MRMRNFFQALTLSSGLLAGGSALPLEAATWNVAVTLGIDSKGNCVVTHPVVGDPLYVVRATLVGDTINWAVTNTCGRPMAVALTDPLAVNSNENGDYPFTQPVTAFSTSVPSGQTATITATLRASSLINQFYARLGTHYKYEFVEVSGSGQTPMGGAQIEVPK